MYFIFSLMSFQSQPFFSLFNFFNSNISFPSLYSLYILLLSSMQFSLSKPNFIQPAHLLASISFSLNFLFTVLLHRLFYFPPANYTSLYYTSDLPNILHCYGSFFIFFYQNIFLQIYFSLPFFRWFL